MDTLPPHERRDVFVFPAPGTYRRIRIQASELGSLSFKAVPVPAEVAEDGEPFRILFVDPSTNRRNVPASP